MLLAQLEKQGWSKMKVIASIATPENEKSLEEKVREMSKATLETFVNELKKQNHEFVKNRPGAAGQSGQQLEQSGLMPDLEQPATQHIVPPPRISVRMPLKPQTELRLRQLQKKLSREQKAPVDFNTVMETLLDTYEKSPPAATSAKLHAATSSPEPAPMTRLSSEIAAQTLPEISSRYIPAKVRNIINAEHGGRCAYPGCQKLPEIYHHTRRFALFPNHDPDFLASLCKNHERLAHHGLIENEEQPPEQWQVKTEADKTSPKYWIDRRVNDWRAAS